MVGQLAREGADISTSGLTHTVERAEVIDFTSGIILDSITVNIKNPRTSVEFKSTVDFMGFAKVFNLQVWTIVLTSMFVVTATHFAISYTDTHSDITKKISRGLSVAYVSLLQIDPKILDHRLSIKIFLVTLSSMCFVLYAYYTGDITAQMTVRKPIVFFRNFHDVLNAGYRVMAQPGTSEEYYLKTARSGSAAAELYQHYIDNNLYGMTTEEFHADDAKLLKFHLLETPKVLFASVFALITDPYVIPLRHFEDAVPSHLAFGLQLDSEFGSMFNHYLSVLSQSGLLAKISKRWLEREPRDETNQIFVPDASPLDFENLYFPGTMISVGLIAALAFLLVELVAKRVSKLLIRHLPK